MFNFTKLAGEYDRLNHVLSMGLDRYWRRRGAKLLGECGETLDLAAGTGDFARELCASHLTLLDITPAMLEIAKTKVPQAEFIIGDAAKLPFAAGRFDTVTCAFGFRNFPDIPSAIAEVARVLKPGGRLLVLEFFKPHSQLFRIFTRLWVKFVARICLRKLVSDCDYLCTSIDKTLSESEFITHCAKHGLTMRRHSFFLPCCTLLLFNYNSPAT